LALLLGLNDELFRSVDVKVFMTGVLIELREATVINDEEDFCAAELG